MKKILLVTLEFPPKHGGVSYQLFNQMSQFPPDKIVVLTPKSEGGNQNFPYPTFRDKIISTNPIIWPKWIFLVPKIYGLVRKHQIEKILAGQILPIGTAALLIKKLSGIPFAVYVYGLDLLTSRGSTRKSRLIKSILVNAELIIANSNYTKQLVEKILGHAEKCIVSYPCPNFSQKDIKSSDQIMDFKIKNNLSGRRILLTVGNLVYRKNHDSIIRSLIKLISLFPNILYLIVGQGPERSHLEDSVETLNLSQHVRFVGGVPSHDLPFYYQSADVFVMPSREIKDNQGKCLDIEGFGMVFLEANVFGRPVIGGKNGGQPEAIEDNITGFLVNPEDTALLIEKISLLLNDQALAMKIGSQGQQRIKKQFQWQIQAEKIGRYLN